MHWRKDSGLAASYDPAVQNHLIKDHVYTIQIKHDLMLS